MMAAPLDMWADATPCAGCATSSGSETKPPPNLPLMTNAIPQGSPFSATVICPWLRPVLLTDDARVRCQLLLSTSTAKHSEEHRYRKSGIRPGSGKFVLGHDPVMLDRSSTEREHDPRIPCGAAARCWSTGQQGLPTQCPIHYEN
jgi:hypothetical protein